jgi:O-antigen/teichoic acid export membrane protein
MPSRLFRGLVQSFQDPLRRNSIYLMATHGVIGLFGFFFWKIADKQYGTPAVSQATALVSAVLLLHILARLGLDIGLIRFLPEEKDKPGMINAAFTIVGLVSGVLAVVVMAGVGVWFPSSQLSIVIDNTGYAFLFVVFTVASSLVELMRQGVFVAGRSTQSSLVVEVVAGVRLLLVLALVALGSIGIFLSWGLAALASLAVGMGLVVVFQRDYRPVLNIRRGVVGRMLRFSGGNYIAETLREMPGFLLPIIVSIVFAGAVASGEDVNMTAYFYIPWTIASGVMMIAYATGSSLLAEGSLDPRGFGARSLRAFQFMLLLLAVGIGFVFLAGGWLLAWFDSASGGHGYSDNGLWLLRLLSLSGVPIAVSTIYVTYKRMQRRLWPVIMVYGFVAVFTIGVGYALLDEMGLTGIGLAWLASNCAVALVACILMTTGWLRARRKRRQGRAAATTS